MTIFRNDSIYFDFPNKFKCLEYVVDGCLGLKKSLRLIEKDTEHLTVRCPVSGDSMEIVGDVDELQWLDEELHRRGWYRTN